MWDNWLVFAARRARVPVIDASDCVHAIHQNHDYSHHVGGEEGVFKGAEAVRNLELGGGYEYAFTIDDVTHVLVNGRPKLALDAVHLRRRISPDPSRASLVELFASRIERRIHFEHAPAKALDIQVEVLCLSACQIFGAITVSAIFRRNRDSRSVSQDVSRDGGRF
jgi:hypothetical protein